MRRRVGLLSVFMVLAACGRGASSIAGRGEMDQVASDVPLDDIVIEVPSDDARESATFDAAPSKPEPGQGEPDSGDALWDPGGSDHDFDPPGIPDDAARSDDLWSNEDRFLGAGEDRPWMLDPEGETAGETTTDAALDWEPVHGADAGHSDPGPPPPPFTCWADSFEWAEDPGWEATGLWHRIHASQDLADVWAGPPYDYVVLNGPATLTKPKDGTHAFWYGRNEDGSYLDEAAPEQVAGGGTSTEPHEGVLVSPWLDLTGMDHATLFFWSWWEIESQHPAGYDLSTVEASDDGQTWTEVARLNPPVVPPGANPVLPYTVNGVGMPPSWHRTVASLDAFAGAPVRIRFRFRTGDVFYNAFRGWMVDEVSIECVAQRGTRPSSP